ncbi:MAG: type II toxin-antitoxin system HicA family toxin [Flavobacteriales bacterium]
MKCSEPLRKLKRAGWYPVRQKGSHVLMEHPTKPGQIVVPDHGSSELASGTARSIMKKAGLS